MSNEIETEIEIAETGYWCECQGIYFSDRREIEDGHYCGDPCGEQDHDGTWIPHVVTLSIILKGYPI